jgi:hypothetical protein
MKKYLDIRNIIILVLTASTALVAINPKGIMPNRVEYLHRIDSIPYPVHDTVEMEVEVEVEVPVEVEVLVEKLVEVPVMQKVDTAEILKIYTAKTEYKDVLVLPNNQGTVAVTDEISQNKIVSRKIDAKVKQTTVRDTVYTPEPRKTTYYFGFDSKFDDPNYVRLLGLGFIIKDKRDRIYRISGGVENTVGPDRISGSFTPYVGGGIYWKIGSKK